jgi:hypothetical protein
MNVILKIQSLWRGYQIRKLYKFYKAHNRNNKYFTYDEYLETIDKTSHPMGYT